jgi:chaperonin cofactor prefoldin
MTNKLNEMDARVYAQTAKIDSLINTIGTMAARIQTLETQLLLFKVKTAGTGPTAD